MILLVIVLAAAVVLALVQAWTSWATGGAWGWVSVALFELWALLTTAHLA